MKRKFISQAPLSMDAGLLILRLISGGLMLSHGWPKLQKIAAGTLEFGDPIGIGQAPSLFLAVFAEVICSVLVILGLLTRAAVIPLIITMAVAFFIVHGADPLGVKELSLIYLGIFLTLFFTGPGKYAIER